MDPAATVCRRTKEVSNRACRAEKPNLSRSFSATSSRISCEAQMTEAVRVGEMQSAECRVQSAQCRPFCILHFAFENSAVCFNDTASAETYTLALHDAPAV